MIPIRIDFEVLLTQTEVYPLFAFREILNMRKHPLVDAMNNRVRPEMPINTRPEPVLIPGCSFKQRCSIRQRLQFELTSSRDQVVLNVRWM